MSDNKKTDVDRLRLQFALSYHDDGLIDLFVGWAILCAGLYMHTGATIFSFIGWMPLVLVAPLKYGLVLPRRGYAKFKRPNSIPLPVLAGVAVLLIIGALSYQFLFSGGQGFAIAIAILAIGVLALLATGLNRIALYALFIPVFFVAGLGLGVLTPMMVVFVGAALMLLGICLLVIFFRKYPLPEESETDEQG